jgi:hypothetical protein
MERQALRTPQRTEAVEGTAKSVDDPAQQLWPDRRLRSGFPRSHDGSRPQSLGFFQRHQQNAIFPEPNYLR